ncbi:hypothetical protein [Archaeoglobus veneficus]|uniref:Uncharacterized protein n=1 Tax=Archaeoglobus veneficus (strain DSM 11195 / SNP6) TaxID=693661 RepID=F2KSI4_ARCVS|nr:hypothetical protein [Archaeoglobus veneficus]AEA48054.1 hypothetical protein Arcve_2064 [Archaeoglobus veneficus SNP6]
MTGKTLTINDLMRVPVAQPAGGVIRVPAEPVEDAGDMDLLTLLERLNGFVNNLNRLVENSKELISNLAANADKLMLPPGIADKLRMFQAIGNMANQPISNLPRNAGPSIDKKQILQLLNSLPIPDDASWKEVKEFANKILGGQDAGADSGQKEG